MVSKRLGFTLIEIVIAIMLVGIFSVIVGPRVMDWIGRGNDKKAATELKTFKGAIQLYVAEIGSYPNKLLDLVQKPTSGEGINKWRRPFVDPDMVKIADGQILDPWNNPYQYKPTRGGKRQFELFSNGDPEAEVPAKIDAWEK